MMVPVAAAMGVLDPASPEAEALSDLWWYLFIACTVVWIVVALVAVLALRRGTRRTEPDLSVEGTRASTRWVVGAMSVSIVLLLSMLVATVATGRAVSPFYEDDAATREIHITGHQWWWQIQYANRRADRVAETSNELHLPAGERVRLILDSADVIHSLWIPNLHGKRDLIPGKKAILTIQADTPGIYRSQCAEFCGHQHAKMGMIVVVEPRAEFERWLTGALLPAAQPRTAEQSRGQDVFLETTCALCHTIHGTSAGSHVGPDLTHFASRRTLAAATLANNRDNLHAWIADPQSIKPGVRMPPNAFAPSDLQALVAYLESLR